MGAALREALDRSADPVVAAEHVERILAAHPQLAGEIESDSLLRESLIALAVASHSLFAALERDPDAVAMLRSETLLGGVDFAAEARAVVTDDEPARALRRWKRRQIVRIAGRDLLGIATMRDVGAELAALAQACLDSAVSTRGADSPLRRSRDGQARGPRTQLCERRRRALRARR